MVSAGSYILSAALLAVLALSLGFSAVRLRRSSLPAWEGAPAHLIEAILGVALLIWISQLLGVVSLLLRRDPRGSVASACGSGCFSARGSCRGGGVPGLRLVFRQGESAAVRDGGRGEKEDAAVPRHPPSPPPAGGWLTAVAVGVVALVFAHWGLRRKTHLVEASSTSTGLVPPSVCCGYGAEPLGHRAALHRDRLHQLVLPAERRASAWGRDPAHPPRHAELSSTSPGSLSPFSQPGASAGPTAAPR